MIGDHKVKTKRPQPKSLDRKAHPKHKDKLTNTKGVQVPGFTKNKTKRGAPAKQMKKVSGSTRNVNRSKVTKKTGQMVPGMGNPGKVWKPFGM